MRTLYTLSYPELSAEHAAFVESFRQENDLPHGYVLAAHFTLVFGCDAVLEPEYLHHVESIAAGSRAIPFSCRCATPGTDRSDQGAHVFLVPDEGYDAISLLHDRLYTGFLAAFLDLDVPYVPHSTIATVKDKEVAQALCDRLNLEGVRVDGLLRSLTVGVLADGGFRNLSSYRLDGW